jgi:hypothetical protein
VSASVANRRQRKPKPALRAGLGLLAAAVLAACAPQPEPRTVFEFMEDGLARDGVLTRCNRDRDATLTDTECANARRAAAAIALEADRARQSDLERASEAKLLALREREARQNPPAPAAANSAPTFGAPIGAIMPSMSPEFDVYADGTDPFRRPTLEIEEAEPPPNNLEFDSPQIVLSDLKIEPRPFRADEVAAQ